MFLPRSKNSFMSLDTTSTRIVLRCKELNCIDYFFRFWTTLFYNRLYSYQKMAKKNDESALKPQSSHRIASYYRDSEPLYQRIQSAEPKARFDSKGTLSPEFKLKINSDNESGLRR